PKHPRRSKSSIMWISRHLYNRQLRPGPNDFADAHCVESIAAGVPLPVRVRCGRCDPERGGGPFPTAFHLHHLASRCRLFGGTSDPRAASTEAANAATVPTQSAICPLLSGRAAQRCRGSTKSDPGSCN